jgi:hypothetical protein
MMFNAAIKELGELIRRWLCRLFHGAARQMYAGGAAYRCRVCYCVWPVPWAVPNRGAGITKLEAGLLPDIPEKAGARPETARQPARRSWSLSRKFKPEPQKHPAR